MGGSTAVAAGGRLGVVALKPSTWPRVNGPAASITTSKVAASLPWRASSAAYSSAWSRRASSSSVSAGGGYSARPAGAFPRALELTPGSAAWPLGPPAQMPAVASIIAGGAGASSGAEAPVGGASPTSISASASSTSSSIGPSTGRNSSYACASSRPGADRDCSSTGSAPAKHSPGTTSSAYQWPPSPPQFGHLQFGSPSGLGTNWEAAGRGTTVTGRVYVPTFTCGQERS